MLFNSKDAISQPTAEAIARAVFAVDAFAQVRVDAPNRQIRIDGRLTVPQAVIVLGNAGCDACIAEGIDSSHVQGGSTCCGSCS